MTEVLDSDFKVHRDLNLEREINNYLGDKIHSGHTSVMYSDHMKNDGPGTAIIKIMRRDPRQIEYHFHSFGEFKNHKMDRKTSLHAMKIIHDDAKKHLAKGHKIALQAANDEQHQNYAKLGKRLADSSNRIIRDVGQTDRLDGKGTGPTHIIGEKYNTVPFSQFRSSLKD